MSQDKKAKVLVVQDNPIFQEVVAEKLTAVGYRVVHKETSVTLNDVRDIKPDVMVIDVVSPKEVGFQFVEKLKKTDDLKNVPLVGLVKAEDSVISSRANEAGIIYVVDKVIFQAKDLIDKIEKSIAMDQTENNSNTETTKSEAAPKAEQNNGGDRVLLVEDDAFMRDMFRQSLVDAGFDTHASPDAEDGLDALAGGFVPHVVLLDLLLPGKSGFEFLGEVRKDKKYEHMPIIVISNLGSKGDIDRAMELGATDFLIKANSTIDEIIKKTREYIEKSKRGPASLPESVASK